jgi:hypothetical protein
MKEFIEKNWHHDVMAAMELVREEVQKAEDQIYKAGGAEMQRGNKKVARQALNYVDKIDEFLFDLEKVGDKWQKLQDEIYTELPSDVQEVVLPTKVRETKGGYTRNVTEIAPWTNFTVKFNNVSLIEEETAKAVFVKALEYFDLDKIEALGIRLNNEPLISRDKAVFKKYPQSVALIKGGWYVSTYSSTATKAKYIEELAKRFNIKVAVKIIPHKAKRNSSSQVGVNVIPKLNLPKTIDDGRLVDGLPFKVSEVVCSVMPEVFKRKLITQDEINNMLEKSLSKYFKTGGWAPLKINRGNDEDRYVIYKNGKKIARYYSEDTVKLELNGQKYYLSSQFVPAALTPVVEWLNNKGITKEEIYNLCIQRREASSNKNILLKGISYA